MKQFVLILFGVFWISLGLNFFLLPHGIASAGVGAIGFLFESQWQIDRNYVVTLINLAMLGLGFLLLERTTFLRSVIGSLIFPLVMWLTPEFRLFASFSLSLVTGSFFFSLGIYSLYRIGASNGGVTIPPLIFERHFNLKKSTGIFLTNSLIILLNFVVFGPKEAGVAAISIYLISWFVEMLTKNSIGAGITTIMKRQKAKKLG